MHITSREYKVSVDGALFTTPAAGCHDILLDLIDLARTLGLGIDKDFNPDDPDERTILFLDTPDFTLRQNGLLLRQRVKHKNDTTEYTLKLRTEDRYIAEGRDISAKKGLKPETKFEEDIGVPFVSRFSHSGTISLAKGAPHADVQFPPTLAASAEFFPPLLTLTHDNRPCAPETALAPVNGMQVYERVFSGPVLNFPASPTTAEIALILWYKGNKGRLLTAEFSFRYKDENEKFGIDVASLARRFFEGVQRLDWARPEATTKTQFMYRSA